MIKIAPSILSADFSCLGQQVDTALKGGADYIHIDVMDGHFVPNITIGPLVVKSLRSLSDVFLDTHLMISDPVKYIPAFAKAGASLLTVHIEVLKEPAAVFRQIREFGIQAGLTLSPPTSFQAVAPYLADIDQLLIMTVNPGFGGQSFMTEMMPKVEAAARIKAEKGLKFDIEVDGGISEKTVRTAYNAGARVFVAGNAVFGGDDIAGNIRKIRAQCK